MKIMAVDLGDARTGLAISDIGESLASPLCVINEKDPQRLIASVADAARQHEVGEIVVGYPKNMDGSIGQRAQKARDFADQLARETGKPVRLWDERCTTVMANSVLNVTDTRGKKRKAILDSVAAVIILQDYLDNKKGT